MASSAEAATLTERHRRQQIAATAPLLADVLRLWRMVDLENIDESFANISPALAALTRRGRQVSAVVAADYYTAFRRAEGVNGAYRAEMFATMDEAAVATSLRVTGPVAFKRSISAGMTPTQASSQGLTMLSGAALRHTLNGGRNTITGNVDADARALGWARVTADNPCSFCAMLASRGFVYKSEQSAKYRSDGRTYHDSCRCAVEPMFSRTAALPDRSEQFAQTWRESTAGLSGQAAQKAFRKVHERRST